jgi:hypothetical protein
MIFNNYSKKKINYNLLALLLYFSLILGFFFNENTLGGSYADYQAHKLIAREFSQNFIQTLFTYDTKSTRHSPVLLIIFSIFEKFEINDSVIRLINLHVLLLIIYFFWKCIKIKFKFLSKDKVYFLSLIIFLSPTFRSLTIWPDSRLYGLLFFVIAIFYFLKFLECKEVKSKFICAILNSLFLCISSYFSPNFSLFVIFFLINFFIFFRLTKFMFLIILLNLILSLPAIYYVFFLKIYFFLLSTSEEGMNVYHALNPANKIILISSIFLFHFLPFFFITKLKFKFINFIIIIPIFFISALFFNYDPSVTGGGVFYKISDKFFSNNYFLYIVSLLGLFVLSGISSINYKNFVLIILIFLNNPQLEIYHKYYDPMLLILFFTLFDLNIIRFKLEKKILFFYVYYSAYFCISFFR